MKHAADRPVVVAQAGPTGDAEQLMQALNALRGKDAEIARERATSDALRRENAGIRARLSKLDRRAQRAENAAVVIASSFVAFIDDVDAQVSQTLSSRRALGDTKRMLLQTADRYRNVRDSDV